MKKIGEGWQYAVYDIGSGRVLKKFHSRIGGYWVILKTIFPFNNDSLWVIPRYFADMEKKALESFAVLRRNQVPDSWIGHPKFLNTYDFEQDKVRPLHEVFESLATAEIKRLIDKFIAFNQKLLERGIIDKSFNITKNYGLSAEGEIVLIDIGELSDDPIFIKTQLNKPAWAEYYVADCIKDTQARTYFLSEMKKYFYLA